MIDIDTYVRENSELLFGQKCSAGRFVIKAQKNTGNIYFCSMFSEGGEKKGTVVLKHYHDCITPSLEYNFAKAHEADFLQKKNVRIPSYIYLDEKHNIVVSKFVDNSLTFEKYLLSTRSILLNRVDVNWFRLAGRWLAHFHQVTASTEVTKIDGAYVLNDLRDKWLTWFPNASKISDKFSKVISDEKMARTSTQCRLSKMHREYGPGNILIASSDLYGMDFGNREMAPPYDDISYFIVACITLNNLPHHPLYKKISLQAPEIKAFLSGYTAHYSFGEMNLFDDKLLILFLWKNLIRRMSGKLKKISKYPPDVQKVVRLYIVHRYHQLEEALFSYL